MVGNNTDVLGARNTVGSSAVLGIIEDNHLSADQFNTLGSAFYMGHWSFVHVSRHR